MGKFLIGAVIVIVALAAGIGAAALAGPRVGQYIQSRVTTSSRLYRSPNQFPFPGARPPRNGTGVPGYHGINGQGTSQNQDALAALGSYSQWNDSSSKIAGLPDFSSLNGGQ
ncbi:MAG: hypothetical protein P4L50_24380 [Anaerolineaceae bacterium]|nr:hypothetical protein [Anaerolineaceae bacterium]